MKINNRSLLFGVVLASMFIVAASFTVQDTPLSRELPSAASPSAVPDQQTEARQNPSALAVVPSVGLGPLPDLPVDAEQFVRSADNPYRCLRGAGLECSAKSENPMIARSPAEARWMMDQGYPETALREMVAGWSSVAIRQEAERSGSMSLVLLALEQQAREATSPQEVEAIADEIGRWGVDRERRLGRPGGGTYVIAARAKTLAQAYRLAEAKEQGSGRGWATAAVNRGFEALVWGDTLALEHVQPFFWRGVDEYMTFSDTRSAMQRHYQYMRVASHARSRGVSLPTISEIRIRPVPEFREVRTIEGRSVERWIGER